MSEPKHVSPLLDGFAMGNPISDHDGVRCCPAIKENTDKKYIVKIISIPASQVQMDAMLLAGAFKDPADVMDYYNGVAEGVVREAELLRKLSEKPGFLTYEGWQIAPITRHRLGYEVYLISSYKRTLDKCVRQNPVTHLQAINLGIDMCAALTTCRDHGAMYVDLKPTNIFVSEKKEYSIGDLGFIRLDELSYAVLPDKYHSQYTPPELEDPMANINMTVDTYALGMILYQLYNDGQVPNVQRDEDTQLPSPIHADYELAEIIMKAIAFDPAQRWQTPKEMEQALIAYMQRNKVNDVPITPYIPLDMPEQEPEPTEDGPQEAESEKSAPEQTPAEEPAPEAEDSAELSGGEEEALQDETLPAEEDADSLQPHEMSEALTEIIEKADDLIAHETPSGVVMPEIPAIPDPFAFAEADTTQEDDFSVPREPLMEEAEQPKEEPKPVKKKKRRFISPESKRRTKRIIAGFCALLIMALIGCGAFWYYQNIYLQNVSSISVHTEKDRLIVTVDTQADEALITVICSDNYGNTQTQPLKNKAAIFSDLTANTMYKIHLEIDGFHGLSGQTSDIFTTDTTTNIVSFTAVTGAVDGSVQLSFTSDGDEPREWKVVYSAPGEEEKHRSFTGHTVTIDGLTVGKLYTFTLDAGQDLSLSGQSTLEYLASPLILAQNLTISTTNGSDLTIRWNAPGDILVDSWSVRCYNDLDFEQRLTVSDTEVYFTGIDPTLSYTVEVTASGMTQPARASITANPINITSWKVDDSQAGKLNVSWDYLGDAPAGGWLLMYSIDGSENYVVKCEDTSGEITLRIPEATYRFTLQAVDGTSLFSNVHSYTAPAAEAFNANSLTAENISGFMLETPEKEDWTYADVADLEITDALPVGDPLSVVLHAMTDFYVPGSKVTIRYVFRDAHGNVLPELIHEETVVWKDLWYTGDYHYAEMDLPAVPLYAGDYTLTIYFDEAEACRIPFTLTN